MSNCPPAEAVSGLPTEPMMPDDFATWSPAARRAWLAGGMTQREMLNYGAEKLGLTPRFDGYGSITNRELAIFIVAATEPVVGDTS